MTATNANFIPFIIVSRDRASYTSQLISWLESVGHQNIIICDNDSTYEPMLELLKNTPHTVYESKGINGHLSPWFNGLVESLDKNTNYFVSDCDVVPDDLCPSDAISYLNDSFNFYKNNQVNKIGLSLRINDLPDCYGNKEQVIKWESQFWMHKINDYFFNAIVDTTFAIYGPGSNPNVFNSLRTVPPYSARHLPWYSDSSSLTEEERHYFNRADQSVTTWTHLPVKDSHII
jgi:hypothetical protein